MWLSRKPLSQILGKHVHSHTITSQTQAMRKIFGEMKKPLEDKSIKTDNTTDLQVP